MGIEGKTISRVIDGDYAPWIVFTDGTGIELNGWEEGASFDEVSAEQVAEHEAKLAERALKAHRQAAYHASWMMRSCEERGELRVQWIAERLAAQPKSIIPFDFEDSLMDSMVWDLNRTAFGAQPAVKARCPVCNERGCPNAPVMQPPNRGLFHQSDSFTIPVHRP